MLLNFYHACWNHTRWGLLQAGNDQQKCFGTFWGWAQGRIRDFAYVKTLQLLQRKVLKRVLAWVFCLPSVLPGLAKVWTHVMFTHSLCSSGALSDQRGIGGTRDSCLVFHFTFAAQICGQGLEGTVASSTLCSRLIQLGNCAFLLRENQLMCRKVSLVHGTSAVLPPLCSASSPCFSETMLSSVPKAEPAVPEI